MHIDRWLKPKTENALRTRRVILLTGPRQSGKTTLSKELVGKGGRFITLDDLTYRQAAISDPNEFVKTNTYPMIIDEVQRSPDLLPAIKKMVDENSQPGQYILTGSSNVQALPTVQESLAGRVCNLQLMTLSEGEIRGIKPNFIRRLFDEDFSNKSASDTKKDIIQIALRGGFPETLSFAQNERSDWYRDYIQAILRRDLMDITKIRDFDAMEHLIHILAAWSGKLMDLSKICAHLSIQRLTARSYINALELMYFVEKVKPWTKTDYDRVGKQDKIFMCDSGFLPSLLGWDELNFIKDGDRIGKLIETFILHEILSQIRCAESVYRIYHYRDREKREIDFLLENQKGNMIGIEVKSSSSVEKKDFSHLHWFRYHMAKEKDFIGIVLYTGSETIPFGKKSWAVPISMLWTE